MQHRHRWMVPLAVATAIAVLAGWFPAAALWRQQSEIDQTSAQIQAVLRQEQALSRQARSVDTRAAAMALAREQYQLVSPGQSLIQVLPGDSSGQVSASSADPGLQPLVSPASGAPLVTAAKPADDSFGHYLSRLVRTLEFWR